MRGGCGFFFQAEDGIRAADVTGVQTCALPISAGTASPLAKQPGAPIFGKTGTAEFDDNPEHTHSWFIGFRGDVAFAVFVENGGLSTDTAVPLAGKFFTVLG